MRSLSARLLVVVSVLLTIFFGLTIIILELGFERSAEKSVEDRLGARVIMLLSSAQTENGRLEMPATLPEPLFATPGSGVIGQIQAGHDSVVWRSASAVGIELSQRALPFVNQRRFDRVTASDGEEMFALSLAVAFDDLPDRTAPFTVTVAERTAPYWAQVSRFRRQLLTYFSALAILLLAAQAVALRWVLSPLRKVADEIRQIEQGDQRALSQGYPSELAGLTRNTNRLLDAERKRRARYRNTLGNLAHSLKTPLAVLRTALDVKPGHRDDALMEQQIDRMNEIVSYQLQRAGAGSGINVGQEKIDLVFIVGDIVEALNKVYADRGVACRMSLPDSLRLLGDRGDVMEMLGNVLDNAYKWAHRDVHVSLSTVNSPDGGPAGFAFVVEDDGPGIAEEARDAALARGGRLDETVAGQGIGLAVVRELVDVSGGDLTLDRAQLGGLRVTIRIAP
ncbi:MAG: ATP-binding protein [Pseudomonadota bacterium]